MATRHTPGPAADLDGSRRVFGTVAGVAPQPCQPALADQEQQPLPGGPAAVCGTVTVTLTSGPQAGTRLSTDIRSGPGALRVDAILLLLDPDGGGQGYSSVDFQRSTQPPSSDLACRVDTVEARYR